MALTWQSVSVTLKKAGFAHCPRGDWRWTEGFIVHCHNAYLNGNSPGRYSRPALRGVYVDWNMKFSSGSIRDIQQHAYRKKLLAMEGALRDAGFTVTRSATFHHEEAADSRLYVTLPQEEQ